MWIATPVLFQISSIQALKFAAVKLSIPWHCKPTPSIKFFCPFVKFGAFFTAFTISMYGCLQLFQFISTLYSLINNVASGKYLRASWNGQITQPYGLFKSPAFAGSAL